MMAFTPKTRTTKVGTNWWERVVVQRSACAVDVQVEAATQRSPFLKDASLSSPPEDSLAFLYREEVRIGALLGSGTYSNVYEVAGLDLVEQRPDAREDIDYLMNGEARQDLKADVSHTYCTNREAKYAIKHLKPDLLKDTKTFEAAACDLIMEAKFLGQLSHPNILPLRAVAFGGAATFARTGLYDSFFIVVDKIDETLNDRLYCWRQEKIANIDNDENTILAKIEIALQVAGALSYCHDRRLVFRDLKPQNIGLTAEGTVQLFDFGFCRELPRESDRNSNHLGHVQFEVGPVKQEGALEDDSGIDERLYGMSGKGTLMYMSPEVLGTRRYNQKADVYGWACILYEMLTLKKPFTVQSVEAHRQAIYKRGERPPLKNSGIPQSLQKLLVNCWEANIVHRFSMKEAKAHLDFIHSEFLPGLLTAESLHRCLKSTRKLLSPIQDVVTSFVNDVQAGYEDFVKDFPGPNRPVGEKETTTLHTVLMGTTHTGDDLAWDSSISGLSFAEDDEEDLWSEETEDQADMVPEEDEGEEPVNVAEEQEVVLAEDRDLTNSAGSTATNVEEEVEEVTDEEEVPVVPSEHSDVATCVYSPNTKVEDQVKKVVFAQVVDVAANAGSTETAKEDENEPELEENLDVAPKAPPSILEEEPNSILESVNPQVEHKTFTEEDQDDSSSPQDEDEPIPEIEEDLDVALAPNSSPSILEEEPNSILESVNPQVEHTTLTQEDQDGGGQGYGNFEASRRRRGAPRGRNGTLVYHRFYGHVDRNVGKADHEEENQSKVYKEPTLWSNHWTARAA